MVDLQSITVEFADGSAEEATALRSQFHTEPITDAIAAELVLDVVGFAGVAERIIVKTEEFPAFHVDLPQTQYIATNTDEITVSFSTEATWVSIGDLPSPPTGTAYVCLECGQTQYVEGAFRTRTTLWCLGQCDQMHQFERKDRERTED